MFKSIIFSQCMLHFEMQYSCDTTDKDFVVIGRYSLDYYIIPEHTHDATRNEFQNVR